MTEVILVDEVHQSPAGFLHVKVTGEQFPPQGIPAGLGTRIAALVKSALAGDDG